MTRSKRVGEVLKGK